MEGLKKPTGGYWGIQKLATVRSHYHVVPKGTSEETMFLEPDMKQSCKERLPERRCILRDAVTARTNHSTTGQHRRNNLTSFSVCPPISCQCFPLAPLLDQESLVRMPGRHGLESQPRPPLAYSRVEKGRHHTGGVQAKNRQQLT